MSLRTAATPAKKAGVSTEGDASSFLILVSRTENTKTRLLADTKLMPEPPANKHLRSGNTIMKLRWAIIEVLQYFQLIPLPNFGTGMRKYFFSVLHWEGTIIFLMTRKRTSRLVLLLLIHVPWFSVFHL